MIKLTLSVIGLVAAMGIAGQADYEEEQRQVEQYCEMVKLWKQTGGRDGWPAYNGEGACSYADMRPQREDAIADLRERLGEKA